MPPLLLTRLHEAGPLLTLAVVIVVGMAAGSLARRIRLPGITGQILVGVVLGPSVLDLFGHGPMDALQPLTHFALGLMAVSIGAHLNLPRLRNAGKRLSYLLLFEALLTPALVFVLILALSDQSPGRALLFATCAVATAPATVVAVISEARAKGVFVKTLVAAVALNNMACIFLFEVARSFAHAGAGEGDAGLGTYLFLPALQLLKAVAIGGAMAFGLETIKRFLGRTDRQATAAILGVVLTSGLADYLGVSALLSCLFLGLIQTNVSRGGTSPIQSVFADFQPAILAVFFTLAGMHLSFEHARLAGFLAVLLFVGRAGGKLLSGWLAMRLARAPRALRRNLGLALIPQAGVAVALVLLIQEDDSMREFAELFAAVVLTVVTVNEIVGPILLRLALERSGESGKDQKRLIDFLQEENIVTEFEAATKEEAIQRLVDLMVTTQGLGPERRAPLLESVLEREAQASTCFGGGLAVPHGILPDGMSMSGVMAISRVGLGFETPDGRPVHCMVLLGTSSEERDRHLQVLATLARMIGTDPGFQTQLFNAKSAAHASNLLHGDKSEGFNYFLSEDA